jgi:hypothetical protein
VTSPAFPTRTYHALAHDFRLTLLSPEQRDYFEQLLDAFPEAPDGRLTDYTVVASDADDGGLQMRADGEQVVTSVSLSGLATSFVHHVNSKAIQPDYAVMSHAGGVERDGTAVVLPAHMESGKTTLTTGLVRAGFGYLTDEAVAFDWETGIIEPYPKPLSIDAGSWFLFPELTPAPAPGEDAPPVDQWQVPPSAIRADAVGAPSQARFVVFPRYEDGVDTRLTPMTRADALVELAKNTFKFNERPRRALDALAEVVRAAECHRIAVGDLDDACALIRELVDG